MMLSERLTNHDARSGDAGQSHVTGQAADVDLTITPSDLDISVGLAFGWRSGS